MKRAVRLDEMPLFRDDRFDCAEAASAEVFDGAFDPATQWTATMNVNINQYFGLSFTPPSAQNPQYTKNRPTSSPIANYLQTTKCFRKGRGLVPGTLSGPSGPPVT